MLRPGDAVPDSLTLVLGAGIAGLSAAHILSQSGHNVVVVEASDRCGGGHRNVQVGPWHFDVGSIFYEDRARLFALAPGLRELCPEVRRIQRRIDPAGCLRHYPLDPRDILRWKPGKLARGLAEMAMGPLLVRRNGSLDAICRQRLGRTIYEGTGLRNYVARFHNVPPEQIDEEFFTHRMAFVERATRLSSMLRSGWRALRQQPVRKGPPAKLRVRPQEGYDVLFDRIRAELERSGVTFALRETLKRITPPSDARGDFLVETDKGVRTVATVVSTVPLDATHKALFGEPSGLRSVDLLSLFVTAKDLDPEAGNVIFNFHQQGRWKRATVYSRLYDELPDGREALTIEVTLPVGAAPDPEDAFADFAQHLQDLQIAKDLRLEGFTVVPGAYPLYGKGALGQAAHVLERVAAAGVITVGRHGRFEYLPTANAVIRRVSEELAGYTEPDVPAAPASPPAETPMMNASHIPSPTEVSAWTEHVR
ncbi:MAG: FAD-dependent oxidoreductase [Pseudomonadota bacterium]